MWRPGPSPLPTRVLAILAILAITASCATRVNRRQRQRAFEARQAKIEARPEPAWRKRNRPRMTTPTIQKYRKLAKSVGARPVAIDAPCLNRRCTHRVLGRLFEKFDRIEKDQQGVARILILGDSHIAADYISRTIRDRLQHRFGNAGRGFVAVDQKAQYGGRRLSRSNWSRTRIVDGNGPGKAFGFSGMRLDSTRPGAELLYELEPEDDDVVAYYLGHPSSPRMLFYTGSKKIGQFRTRSERPRSRTRRVAIPERVGKRRATPQDLKIVAYGPKAALFGLSFESYEAGVILDAIGPVGADANVYLQMDGASLKQHLRALDPDLVMLMVGGNDALAIRKGQRTIEEVEQDHRSLIRRLKDALPDADCLIWAPLDAGVRTEGRIESKTDLLQIRDMQQRVARKLRCAFWDTYEAMGGVGAFGRWFEKGLMNKDLIHPRSKGGDLLGHLFANAIMNAYLNGS